jgi:hypothetical protein
MDIFLPLFPLRTVVRMGNVKLLRPLADSAPPQPIHGNLKHECLRILQIGIGRQIAVSLMRREL